jgi:diguanylate cyclase (GGDEF)-like protein
MHPSDVLTTPRHVVCRWFVRSRVQRRSRPDATLVGAWFLVASALLGVIALALPDFVRPGNWRLAFTANTVCLALQAVVLLRRRRVSMLEVILSIVVLDAEIVLSAACLVDRSGGRVVAGLFALPSLYLGLYSAAWMMAPQVVAVTGGAFTIMMLGGPLDAMALTGTVTILVSVFTPAFAALVLRQRLVAALRQAKALAVVDPLTGLANRRGIAERAPQMIAQARTGSLTLGVVVADVDHFKRINDVYGHAVGDDVLRLVADAVRSCVREQDVVVRLGGEEIAVLTAAVPDDLGALAERIRQAVALGTAPWSVTVSLGVAWVDRGRLAEDPLQIIWGLVDEADDLMYAAKRAGRNQVMLPVPG